jgi:hypothetical protein
MDWETLSNEEVNEEDFEFDLKTHKNRIKFWIYIQKSHGQIRDFGDHFSIKCETLKDAKQIKKLLHKAGHEYVIATYSISV